MVVFDIGLFALSAKKVFIVDVGQERFTLHLVETTSDVGVAII